MNTQISKASKPRPPRLVAAAALVAVVAAGFAAWTLVPMASAKSASGPDAPASATFDMTKSVATVNGGQISEAEIGGLTAQGVDRAVAIDRYVNKVLAADLARKAYPDDAAAALRGAEREVLSQLFVAKRTQDLKASVKDEEVRAFYDKNVRAEDYASFKTRYFITQEPKEADDVAAAIAAGKTKDVDGKFKPVKDGDGFTTVQELPYGLGQVVRSMKVGDYSRPMVLRNGIFVLRVDEIKPGERPEFAKVASEIKDVLVAQRLSDELSSTRRAARVELK